MTPIRARATKLPMSPSTEGPRSGRWTEQTASLDPSAAIAAAEALTGSAIFVTEAAAPVPAPPVARIAPTAREAIASATAAAGSGRAAVLLSPSELVGALDAIGAAAAMRAPIVVHVASAGDAGTGNRVTPGRHELAPALDVGAGVLVSWTAQDAVDVTFALRRAAEDSETPLLHVLDVPRGAGVSEVRLPVAEAVKDFVGPPRATAQGRPEQGLGDEVARKRAERGFAARVPFALTSAMRALSDRTRRPLSPIERYETADADETVVAVGAAAGAARDVAAAMRAEGRRVGVVALRALRPFFAAEVVKAVARARAVVVVEPLDVALAPGGPATLGLKAAFADALTWAPGYPGVGRIPPIVTAAFATIDGAIGEAEVRAALAEITSGDRARRALVFGSAE